ncbi:hypothetical protein [Methylococcus sp. EFPC2]|uniref:hypothetical protein n=1 Tax=Methylococcus sp. EFPC2 TaxID=2812648 RepID=UPI0019679127|nr:hypothetical protein [Methylococcus sp. EFPC2]QSA98757.1 hypothetical protein JWZ97_08240 [Methylococcus sp. EFPC2]
MSAKKTLNAAMTATALVVGAQIYPAVGVAGLPATSLDIALNQASCPAGQNIPMEVTRLRDDIAHAASVDEARTLALAPTDAALQAVSRARYVMPLSEDLQQAQTRLEEQRSRINAAATPRRVADEFAGMTVAGLDDDRLIHAKVGSHGCSYSSGETIAIVIGLILGIIPGLILLVVLC